MSSLDSLVVIATPSSRSLMSLSLESEVNVNIEINDVEFAVGVRPEGERGSINVEGAVPPLLKCDLQCRAINQNRLFALPYEEGHRGDSLVVAKDHPQGCSRQRI